ncbi:glycosyltransferase family 4 protein [Terrisporobacter vanillatitrophus]|uniref:glycosyltransferase family 4 protein n=1 Tax=Terrisporobacter vanillatitrophus TaxID=3058402 RepID=UPI0033679282
MKKILYVTTVSRTINAFLIPHIEKLIDEGYKVDCACAIDLKVDERILSKGSNIFDIPFSRNPLHPKNIKAFRELRKIQEKNNYDIVHVHTPVASVYGRLLKIKFPKLKTIYTVHGFHFFEGASWINWVIYYPIERLMSRFTDVAITINSEDYKKAQHIGIKEVHNTNGVGLDLGYYNQSLYDKQKCREKFGLRQDDFVIVMIAEVNKNKNHEQMINAVEQLVKQEKSVKVLCAGDGPLLNFIEEEIERRNLSEVIQMLGFRTDINEIISCADVGLLMSYREGLPRNIMELMAFGKPVIGTNIRGIRDLIDEGKNGYLVEFGDYMQTYYALNTLMSDEELLGEMSECAFDRVKKYSVENVVGELLEVYGDEEMFACTSNG